MTNTRRLVTALVVAALAAMPAGPAAQSKPETALRAAIETETIKGDLKGAIEQYKELAQSADRNVAAHALMRMADCYRRVGDAEARSIYERLVREFGDQPEIVAAARARLAAAPNAPAKGDRAVWVGPDADGFGTVSPDGRFLTYVDWGKTGRLMLRNLESGETRPLTKPSWLDSPDRSRGGVEYSSISKDGRQVAYEWWDSTGRELRVASLEGREIPQSRRIVRRDDLAAIGPFDWSPDGRSLAVLLTSKTGTGQIGLISLQDGSFRAMRSSDWKGPTKIFFSPDGRFVAYDLPMNRMRDECHVFVMSVDGTGETEVVAHPSRNIVMGWTPGGHHLLFASDRTGSVGLWAVPIASGRAAGAPVLVRPDTAADWSLGLTAAGTLYVWKIASATYVQVAPIDLQGRRMPPTTGETMQRFVASRGRPEWSSDGQHVAYESCGALGGGPCRLYVMRRDTGAVRQLTTMSFFFQLRWSPQGNSLLAFATDLDGKRGIYLIDPQTGVRSLVAPIGGDVSGEFDWAPDGLHVYRRARQSGMLVIRERNIATGSEREVIRTPADAAFGFKVSPDGRYLATIASSGGSRSVLIVPFDGGAPRSLLSGTPADALGAGTAALEWTPDSHAVIVGKTTGPSGLWHVPIDGAEPARIDADITAWNLGEGFRLRRDGKEIAFVGQAGASGLEIRALSGILPTLAASSTTRAR